MVRRRYDEFGANAAEALNASSRWTVVTSRQFSFGWLAWRIPPECDHGGVTVNEDVVVTEDAGAGLVRRA